MFAAPAQPALAPRVLVVQRMSVSYDGVEDRIVMDVAGDQGTAVRLWFTRYGSDLMVRATVDRVEAYAAAHQAKANMPADQAEQLRQSALATRQLTARLTQRSSTAVVLPPGSAEHLVTGFALPPNRRCIQLDFKCRPDMTVRALLQTAELFQWLAAVQRQYKRAAWRSDAWPAWFGL